jgi:hypothetical protein
MYIDRGIHWKWRYCLCIYVALTRSVNKSITTDPDGVAIDKTRHQHCGGKEQDPRGIEARQLKITSEA